MNTASSIVIFDGFLISKTTNELAQAKPDELIGAIREASPSYIPSPDYA